MLYTLKNYHDYSDKFTEDDGFQIAIGIVDFSTNDFSDPYNRTLEE